MDLRGGRLKFAILENEKIEAQPGLTASCIGCGRPMISKCGDINIWHWAHKNERRCDPWWEKETPWHRGWKAPYPKEWQEVVHYSDTTGEKHIADVKTNLGWVIEIQHSFLKTDERNSRENFYKKLIWIVDGKRRTKDHQKFVEAISRAEVISNSPLCIRKINQHGCNLINDWADSNSPVFFDFGETIKSGDSLIEVVWWLLPKDHNGERKYLMLEPKLRLVQRLRDDATRAHDFETVLGEFSSLVKAREEVERKNREILERRKSRMLGF